ncbi:MAG TPA: SpoIIE family protein phosphatase, partial [Leptospiraceae bacterium]|nr:SpoIIE family protein phosphatase [Leptospiraceae bacterium]
EGVFLISLLAATTYLAFSRNFPIYYLPVPFVVLCALRFGDFGATLGICVLSLIAVFHTVGGRGPFAVYSESGSLSLNNTLILLDAFIFVVTATAYVLVAVAQERQAAMIESMNHLITVEKIKDQANRELEAKVIERTRIIAMQKQELEDQIAVAEKIQMSLLPAKPEKIPRFQIDFRYQPMMRIGGDFVDLRYDPRTQSLGLFICDVNGHGVPAAFLAAMVKMALSDWYGHLEDLQGAIYHIHGSLKDKLGENFITMGMAHIDLFTGKLSSVRAGHHPLLIIRADGSSESLNPKGRMLMADLLPTSDVSTAQLYPGDRIVLYTDGLTEARDRTGKLICSEEDLAERAGDRSRDVSTLCEDIFQDVLSKTGGMDFLEDDITFLIAEYTGS